MSRSRDGRPSQVVGEPPGLGVEKKLMKKISKPKHTRLKFDLEKLKDPNVLETFQAMIGGRFAPLIIMSNKDTDIDSMITTFTQQ